MGFGNALGFGSLEKGVGGNFAGNIAKAVLSFETDDDTYYMRVQYNPSSITYQANAQPIPVKYLQNNVDTSVPTQRMRNASIVMSVQLLFDDTNVKDAFMEDKLRMASMGDIASTATGIYNNIGTRTGYSVMPQTNAILAALLRDTTRSHVAFAWGDSKFEGELTEAQANYTMFSVSGKPVRSTVTINITQEIQNIASDNWDKAFDKVFGTKDKGRDAAKASASRVTGNLLNFNL